MNLGTLQPDKDLQRQLDSVNQTVQDLSSRLGKLEDNDNIPLAKIPQGPGSGLNSDTIDGINASYKAMPNTLIPLGPNGKFPTSVIPAGSSVTMGGDVTGSSNASTVAKING